MEKTDRLHSKTSRFNESASELLLNSKKVLKRHRVLRLFLIFISPFFLYLVFSQLFFGPPSLSDINKLILLPGPDTQLIIWCLHWWPFALSHHINPFITKYIWFSKGFNLTWATSIPTLSLVMVPISLFSNSVVSFNTLTLAAPALSALTCFYLVYFITKNYFGSLFAGYIYGFSTYETTQMEGHASLYVTCLIPLLILVFMLRFHGKLSRVVFIVLSTILLVLQFGISNEILASFMMFTVFALILLYLFSDKKIRKLLLTTSIEFYGSFLISLVILAPYLYYIAVGIHTVPKVINSPLAFSTDLLNYFIPTPLTYYGSSLASTIPYHFTANFSEEGSYIGIPFLLILLYFAIRYWRKAYVKALVGILLLVMTLSLGQRLHVDGTIHNKAILPWSIATHIPLLKSALPIRFSMYIFLVIAIIIGLFLSYKTTTVKTLLKFAVVLLAIVSLAPRISVFRWQQLSVPKVFNAKFVGDYIPKGSNIIVLPYGYYGNSMYYQYASGMWFTQSGGYIGFTPTDESNNQVVATLFTGVVEHNFDQQLTNFCKQNNVAEIIYSKTTNPSLITAINDLDWSERIVQNEVIVKVP